MADKIIANLPKTEATTFDDLLLVVDTPADSPTNKKITLANLFNKVPTWLGFADTVATSAADSLAIPITASIVHKTTGSDAEALTVAAGTQGQLLMIVLTTDGGGTGTIAASSTVADTIAFADAEDTAQLLFTNSKWHFMGGTATVS
tara:strand:+ start:369 stop:809 length:441 start_codon:yes stop_codon:yes gene_type:complete